MKIRSIGQWIAKLAQVHLLALVTGAGVAALVIALILLLALLPERMAPSGLEGVERFNAVDAGRRTIAQIVGGLVVLTVGVMGAYLTWRRVSALEEQVRLAQLGQTTERLSRTIEQLGASYADGKPAVEVRAGAILTLRRIAEESEPERESIIAILSAYLRHRSPAGESSGTEAAHQKMDVGEAFLVVLTLWDGEAARGDTPTLDLSRTNLDGLQLSGLDFRGVNLEDAQLNKVTLFGANFTNTILFRVGLKGALLPAANFRNALLRGADLTDAYLAEADLRGANLREVNLSGADLSGVHYDDDTVWPDGFVLPSDAVHEK